MERDYQGAPNEHALFLAADQKLDKLKDQVSELFQRDHTNKEKIDHLVNRLDFGVSKTGQKNADKITDLAVKINDFDHEMAAAKATLKHQERILGRIMAGIFWVSFAGVLGGLVTLAYQVLKFKMVGG
jgi:hypothetical protein